MGNSTTKSREAKINLDLQSDRDGNLNINAHISGPSRELAAPMVTLMEKEKSVEKLMRNCIGFLDHSRNVTQNN